MSRIGLYGGSFDPIHLGHLILAGDAMEQLRLDKVIFLPARISPHKLTSPPAPPAARLALLADALVGMEGFEMDDCEMSREGPSYTVDTLRLYRTKFPEAELFYFIGDDNLAELNTWKDIDEIKSLARFVILSRGAAMPPPEYFVIRRRIEISSTEIRNRIARGLSVRYFLPCSTNEMIKRLQLYVNE